MKILMVCLGNICRSPLAHGIMEHLVEKNGLSWTIDSAGTGNWHIGQGPDRRSTREASNNGIDISKQVCRQFSVSDFDNFDLIVVMDKENYLDVMDMARNGQDTAKVMMLLGDKEVPDPYQNDSQFAPVFKLIEAGCKELMGFLLKKDAIK